MNSNIDYKLPMTTPDPTDDVVERLREIAPHLFSEGRIDFDKLKELLGGQVEQGTERYGLSWAGKSEAFRNVQTPSVATLLPMPNESVDWDNTENLIIEGDNLEVLKLLQKPYHGKVKMIYIDPPYNTGNEFIYPDNFREGLQDYLRYSGQVSEEGIKQSTNTETSGRFHSTWLSMMYPRLFLARNLLKDDGVIFVSIDDNEVHNLRMLMNEVFGEENFVATVIWQKVYAPKSSARHFSEDHDYVVIYARNSEKWTPQLLPRTVEQDAAYTNPDNDPRGLWRPNNLAARNYYSKGTYSITCPSGRVIEGPPSGSYWRVSEDKFRELDKDGRIWWGKDGNNIPAPKIFISEVKQGRVPQTLWSYNQVGHTQEAKKELLSLVTFSDSDSVFDTPKPPRLIAQMLRLATESQSNDIVLDFFAGSGTTAQAVMELNREVNGNRKFILVQLPEKTENPAFPTIAHITRERVRRVIDKLNGERQIPPNPPFLKGGTCNSLSLKGAPMESLFAENADQTEKPVQDTLPPSIKGGGGDLGFRAFKLSSSNFKIWDADHAPATPDALAEQLKLYADNIEQLRDQQDVLYELILKTGLPLTSRIETLEIPSRQGRGSVVFSVSDGQLLICLENLISKEALHGMMERKPAQILCLDTAFGGDDALKTNTVLEAKSHGVVFRTV
ncbi:MAG: DNA methylase N-4 [Geobacteraceae bacterium GWC2_55_20]|nr:MAG: DNA methylase N-4 [Geobacteraceae bacterium GWC2_55_20]OGU24811.1 MAG: DNA methylase N-4 [Geobacteraceae bacterium GWF2_54_21]